LGRIKGTLFAALLMEAIMGPKRKRSNILHGGGRWLGAERREAMWGNKKKQGKGGVTCYFASPHNKKQYSVDSKGGGRKRI